MTVPILIFFDPIVVNVLRPSFICTCTCTQRWIETGYTYPLGFSCTYKGMVLVAGMTLRMDVLAGTVVRLFQEMTLDGSCESEW